MGRVLEEKEEDIPPQEPVTNSDDGGEDQLTKFPRTFSLAHLLEMDYMGPISQLLGVNSAFDFQGTISNTSGTEQSPAGLMDKFDFFQLPYQYNDSTTKFQLNHIQNQHVFVNPVYELQ